MYEVVGTSSISINLISAATDFNGFVNIYL